MVKLKVGLAIEDDMRRLKVAQGAAGSATRFAIDANQRWGVDQAIHWVRQLADFDPYWIEEPTSPDDILGLAAIRRGGDAGPRGDRRARRQPHRLQAAVAVGAIDVLQIDACRVGGINENLAILLLAAAYGVPVCPHAGGVGLCEMVQHLAMFDFVAVSGSTDGRWIEYIDHLHEHFETPAVVIDGRYRVPTAPGGGARLLDDTLSRFAFPSGSEWTGRR